MAEAIQGMLERREIVFTGERNAEGKPIYRSIIYEKDRDRQFFLMRKASGKRRIDEVVARRTGIDCGPPFCRLTPSVW